MPTENRTLKPGRKANTLVTDTGEELVPPADWQLLPPGDGVLTRLVKAKGPTWQVQVKVGRRIMSRGVWAKGASIAAAVEELKGKRTAPGYELRRAREQMAKARKHQEYVAEFHGAVVNFLDFHPRFTGLAEKLAKRVTELATPVGSGTVARTERIPVADRAGAAVIAWMRHQVTNYDRITIARVKGRRREVRRELAAQSLTLLMPYRLGNDPPAGCPLGQALYTCQLDSSADRLEVSAQRP